MDADSVISRWMQEHERDFLKPVRTCPFIGVQPPNMMEAESADSVQTRLPKFDSPTVEEEHNDREARHAALKRKSRGRKSFEDVSGDAPDGLKWAQEKCGDFMNGIETADDVYKNETDPEKRAKLKKMFEKERKEHPSFTDKEVDQVVKDHLKSETSDRSLGGQVMYDQRYAPLNVNKGKLAEGVAGKPATSDVGQAIQYGTVGGMGSAVLGPEAVPFGTAAGVAYGLSKPGPKPATAAEEPQAATAPAGSPGYDWKANNFQGGWKPAPVDMSSAGATTPSTAPAAVPSAAPATGGNFLSNASGVASNPGAGVAGGALMGALSHPNKPLEGAAGGAGGGVAGQALGAGVGSMFGPVGTIAGGLIGGGMGAKMGGDLVAGQDESEVAPKEDVIDRFMKEHSSEEEMISKAGTISKNLPNLPESTPGTEFVATTQCNKV